MEQRSDHLKHIPWQEESLRVQSRVRALFEAAGEEIFEDGMESRFSVRLCSLIQRHGKGAVEAIAELINEGDRWQEAASEALRWLGRIEDAPTRALRLWVLERALLHPCSQIRDAAGLGLASMGDAHAVPFLVRAVEREPLPELREDLRQVLDELRDSASCRS
jgi:hypothetical protein